MIKNDKIKEIEKHMKAVMDILEIEVTESNEDTPLRIAKMYFYELFKNRNGINLGELNDKMKLFSNEGTNNLITISEIGFNSVCEHHWLPFMGEVSVSYIPDEKIVGLSKIPRVVKYFSQRPQLQERLTTDIGDFLVDLLQPKLLKIEVKATHTCVMCRGAESECLTTTLYEFRR